MAVASAESILFLRLIGKSVDGTAPYVSSKSPRTLELSSAHQPDAFLTTRIDAVVLLDIQTQRIQRVLGDANLLADANHGRPVDNWHGTDKSPSGNWH